MVVDMVSREVGEQRPVEVQTRDALLRDGMAADLHKRILTTGIHHPPQQSV